MHKILLFCLAFFTCMLHYSQQTDASYPFIANKGQWNENIKYKAEVNSQTNIYYEKNAIHYQIMNMPHHHPQHTDDEEEKIQGHIFKALFLNSKESVNHIEYQASDYHYNYFLGKDRSRWKGNVKLFQKIEYQNLYEGIHFFTYQKEGQLKYDYLVEAGKNPNQIQIQYLGVKPPSIQEGNLVIEHQLGKMIEEQPIAFQQDEDGNKIFVKCNYQIDEEGIVGFDFPEGYDENMELWIDPVLIFSTYSGSTEDNFGMTATYDREGNGYMGGVVFGIGYQTSLGAFDSTFNGGSVDISISKFSNDGSQMLYSTYLGGSRNEAVHSLVVNDSLQLFLLGVTNSTNYPTTADAYDTTFNSSPGSVTTEVRHSFSGGTDMVISKFSEDGSQLLASTYYGGNSIDGLNSNGSSPATFYRKTTYNYGDTHRGEIVLDSAGNCYIGSSTSSTNLFAINNAKAKQEGIVVKLNPTLKSVKWARYFGGDGVDAIYSIKVMDSGKVLIGGGTSSSSSFPATLNLYKGGRTDGFISILSADGTSVERTSYVGTADYDQVYFVEFDRFGNIYGFGQTANDNFQIKNSTVADTGAGQFFIKLNPSLNNVLMSTTFGTDSAINISPTAFLVDRCLNIYASGWGGSIQNSEGSKTLNNNMPITADAFRSTTSNSDFYLYVINGNADSVIYASFFGGTTSDDHVDGGTSRFDRDGIIYQSVCASCGRNNRTDFPTKNAVFNRDIGPSCSNAIFKMDFQILPVANFSVEQNEFCLNEAANDSIAIKITDGSSRSDITTWNFNGVIFDSQFSDTTIFITKPGVYFVRQEVEDTICAAGDFVSSTFLVRPDNITLDFNNDTIICLEDSFLLKALHKGTANKFIWSDQADFSNLLPSNDSTLKVKLNPGKNIFYVQAGNDSTNACEKIDSVVVESTDFDFSASIEKDTICEKQEVTFSSTMDNIDRFRWDFDNGIIDTSSMQRTVLFQNPGLFNVQLIVENSFCNFKDSITLELMVEENKLLLSGLEDTLQCGTDDILLTANSGGTAESFQWSSNSNFSDILNSDPSDSTITLSAEGSNQFFVKINDRFCEKTDSLTAEIIRYELALESIPDSGCAPFNLELQTTIIGTDSFRINFGNGNFTNNDPNPTINFQNQGNFEIQLIGSNQKCGIRDTISRTITILPEVVIEPLSDTLFCSGEDLRLEGNAFGTASSFLWDTDINFNNPLNNPTDSSITVSPTTPTTFYFRAENAICNATDSLLVTPDLLNIGLNDEEIICREDSLLIEAEVFSNSDITNFLWKPEDSIISGQNSNRIFVAPRETMQFKLFVSNATGCEDEDSMQVIVNLPKFTTAEILSSLDTAFEGQSVQFSTNRNGADLLYLWEPEEDFDNPAQASTSLRAKETKTYKVTITDLSTSCEVIAFRQLVVFEINCAEPDIFVPTAFTPNDDLTNDILFVRGENLESIEFQLYNRWGEKVFETNDKNKGWDGTYKGKEVDPGVFVFHLKAICFDGQEFIKKGNITLIR